MKHILGRRWRMLSERTFVVAIVVLFVSLAIPIYGKHVKNSRLLEATTHLGSIANDARTYAIENQDSRGNPVWPTGSEGIVSLAGTANFDYAFAAGRGRDARSTPLEIVAVGKLGTREEGVTVRVTVPNIASSAGPPRITTWRDAATAP
jgi:hypothetical protein